MLHGMRLICEQLKILLENERARNSLRQNSKPREVAGKHNGEYPSQEKILETSNTPLQKAVRTPLNIRETSVLATLKFMMVVRKRPYTCL